MNDFKMDIMKIQLDSESADLETETTGKYTFNIKLPVKRYNYNKIVLYVDNWDVQTTGLGNLSYVLNITNISQSNSYNSRTKGNNNVIGSIFSNGIATGRTTDLALNYQAPQTKHIINTLPNSLDIQITDIDNTGIDFSNAVNFWSLSLRLECEYDME